MCLVLIHAYTVIFCEAELVLGSPINFVNHLFLLLGFSVKKRDLLLLALREELQNGTLCTKQKDLSQFTAH